MSICNIFVEYMQRSGNEFIDSPFDLLDNKELLDDSAFEEEPLETEDAEIEEEEEPSDDGSIQVADQAEDKSVNVDTSALKVFAEQWKADGRLPSDFEITDNLSEADIDSALYKHKEKLVSDQIRQEIVSKYNLTEEEIDKLRGNKYGVNPKEYDIINAFKQLANFDVEVGTENFESDTKEFLEGYYTDLGNPPKIAKRNAARDLELDTEDMLEILDGAKKHFSKRSIELKDKLEQSIKDKETAEENTRKANIDKDKEMLQSGKVGEMTLTDAEKSYLEKAFYAKSETIKLKDGSVIAATPYQKKIYEAQQSQEKALQQRIKFMLEEYPRDTAQEKASKGLLKELNTVIKQGSKNIQQTASRSYEREL